MGKLSILGAQRVKALIEVLKDKEKEELNQLRAQKPTESEVKPQVNDEFNVQELMDEVGKIKNRLEEISEELEFKIGKSYKLDEVRNYRSKPLRKYDDRIKELRDGEVDKKIEEVRADYRKREQQLWLCETLEEAKEIVGID